MNNGAFYPAKEIGENITITERSQLIFITPEQIMKIKSLRIENQVIDDEFYDFFSNIDGFDSLYFYRCKVDCLTLSNVYECTELGFVDCSLTSHSAILVLDDLGRIEYVKTLDLSNNKIGVEPEVFTKWWKSDIAGVATVEKIILSNNDFLETSKENLLCVFKKYTPNCQVVF